MTPPSALGRTTKVLEETYHRPSLKNNNARRIARAVAHLDAPTPCAAAPDDWCSPDRRVRETAAAACEDCPVKVACPLRGYTRPLGSETR